MSRSNLQISREGHNSSREFRWFTAAWYKFLKAFTGVPTSSRYERLIVRSVNSEKNFASPLRVELLRNIPTRLDRGDDPYSRGESTRIYHVFKRTVRRKCRYHLRRACFIGSERVDDGGSYIRHLIPPFAQVLTLISYPFRSSIWRCPRDRSSCHF